MAQGPARLSAQRSILLWEDGPIRCTCLTLALDQIEITLTTNGTVVERVVFADHEDAARFAIALMHTYFRPPS